jgi:hypothetical protein
MPKTMKAAAFVEPGRIELAERPTPDIGPTDVLLRVTTTTICGTDVHILKGEYPVRTGLMVGHEPVGIIEKLGSVVTGYREGDRVIAGAIRGVSGGAAARWNAVEPRRLRDGPPHSAQGVCSRPGRSQDRLDAVSWGQGADATTDECDRRKVRGSQVARHASLRARGHRRRVRTLRAPARRSAQGRDHTLTIAPALSSLCGSVVACRIEADSE